MKIAPTQINPLLVRLIGALFRTRRASAVEDWPGRRLAPWSETPPAQGYPLRLEFRHLTQAFKAYKKAIANSEPCAWCRCRYRETHECEFWFATERDRTRVGMLLQLHGLGSVCGDGS